MNPSLFEELRWYHRGYSDGRRGWAAYNDSFVDLTGPLITLRLGRSHTADAYAQGFRDGMASHRGISYTLSLVWASVCAAVIDPITKLFPEVSGKEHG